MFSRKGPRGQTQASQLAGTMFFKTEDPNCDVCKLMMELCAEPPGNKRRPQIVRCSVKRTILVCSNVTQSRYRIFILIEFNAANEKHDCARDDEKLAKVCAARSPGIVHPGNVLELLRACEDLRWNHDKSTSIPVRIENNANSAVRRAKEGIFVLSFQSGLSEKWWREATECLCFFLKHTRQNWQTECHRTKEDVAPKSRSYSTCHVEQTKFIHPISTNLHQFGTKMLPGTFIGYALNSGGGWTRLLIIADWHDVENNVASEVPGNRFKFEEVGIKEIAGSIHMSLRRRSLKTRRSRTTSNSTPPESRELRRGWSTSTMGEARRDLFAVRKGELFARRRRVCRLFRTDPRDAMEARADFWSMSGGFFYCHFVMPREHLYVPKDSSSPIPSKCIDVVRQTKTNLAGSVVIYVQMRSKEAKQQWDTEKNKTKYKLHARRRQVKIFFLTKLKNLTPLFGTPERSWKFQWHQQCLGLHDYASPPPRHRRRTLQCH